MKDNRILNMMIALMLLVAIPAVVATGDSTVSDGVEKNENDEMANVMIGQAQPARGRTMAGNQWRNPVKLLRAWIRDQRRVEVCPVWAEPKPKLEIVSLPQRRSALPTIAALVAVVIAAKLLPALGLVGAAFMQGRTVFVVKETEGNCTEVMGSITGAQKYLLDQISPSYLTDIQSETANGGGDYHDDCSLVPVAIVLSNDCAWDIHNIPTTGAMVERQRDVECVIESQAQVDAIETGRSSMEVFNTHPTWPAGYAGKARSLSGHGNLTIGQTVTFGQEILPGDDDYQLRDDSDSWDRKSLTRGDILKLVKILNAGDEADIAFPYTGTGFRQASAAIRNELKEGTPCSINVVMAKYCTGWGDVSIPSGTKLNDEEIGGFGSRSVVCPDGGSWSLQAAFETSYETPCVEPTELWSGDNLADVKQTAQRVIDAELWTGASVISSAVVKDAQIHGSVISTVAKVSEAIRTREAELEKESEDGETVTSCPATRIHGSSRFDTSDGFFAVSGKWHPNGTGLKLTNGNYLCSCGEEMFVGRVWLKCGCCNEKMRITDADALALGITGKNPSEDITSCPAVEAGADWELHRVVKIYCSFHSISIHQPSIQGVNVSQPKDYCGTPNAVVLKEQFDELPAIAQIIFQQQLVMHPHADIIKLVCMDDDGKLSRYKHGGRYIETFTGGLPGEKPEGTKLGRHCFNYLTEELCKALGTDSSIHGLRDVMELQDLFNPKGSVSGRRREKHLSMSLGPVTEDSALQYTEERIESDLRCIAKQDERIAAVIDIDHPILTTEDAEFDRAMIYQGVEAATARLKAAGRYPVVEDITSCPAGPPSYWGANPNPYAAHIITGRDENMDCGQADHWTSICVLQGVPAFATDGVLNDSSVEVHGRKLPKIWTTPIREEAVATALRMIEDFAAEDSYYNEWCENGDGIFIINCTEDGGLNIKDIRMRRIGAKAADAAVARGKAWTVRDMIGEDITSCPASTIPEEPTSDSNIAKMLAALALNSASEEDRRWAIDELTVRGFGVRPFGTEPEPISSADITSCPALHDSPLGVKLLGAGTEAFLSSINPRKSPPNVIRWVKEKVFDTEKQKRVASTNSVCLMIGDTQVLSLTLHDSDGYVATVSPGVFIRRDWLPYTDEDGERISNYVRWTNVRDLSYARYQIDQLLIASVMDKLDVWSELVLLGRPQPQGIAHTLSLFEAIDARCDALKENMEDITSCPMNPPNLAQIELDVTEGFIIGNGLLKHLAQPITEVRYGEVEISTASGVGEDDVSIGMFKWDNKDEGHEFQTHLCDIDARVPEHRRISYDDGYYKASVQLNVGNAPYDAERKIERIGKEDFRTWNSGFVKIWTREWAFSYHYDPTDGRADYVVKVQTWLFDEELEDIPDRFVECPSRQGSNNPTSYVIMEQHAAEFQARCIQEFSGYAWPELYTAKIAFLDKSKDNLGTDVLDVVIEQTNCVARSRRAVESQTLRREQLIHLDHIADDTRTDLDEMTKLKKAELRPALAKLIRQGLKEALIRAATINVGPTETPQQDEITLFAFANSDPWSREQEKSQGGWNPLSLSNLRLLNRSYDEDEDHQYDYYFTTDKEDIAASKSMARVAVAKLINSWKPDEDLLEDAERVMREVIDSYAELLRQADEMGLNADDIEKGHITSVVAGGHSSYYKDAGAHPLPNPQDMAEYLDDHGRDEILMKAVACWVDATTGKIREQDIEAGLEDWMMNILDHIHPRLRIDLHRSAEAYQEKHGGETNVWDELSPRESVIGRLATNLDQHMRDVLGNDYHTICGMMSRYLRNPIILVGDEAVIDEENINAQWDDEFFTILPVLNTGSGYGRDKWHTGNIKKLLKTRGEQLRDIDAETSVWNNAAIELLKLTLMNAETTMRIEAGEGQRISDGGYSTYTTPAKELEQAMLPTHHLIPEDITSCPSQLHLSPNGDWWIGEAAETIELGERGSETYKTVVSTMQTTTDFQRQILFEDMERCPDSPLLRVEWLSKYWQDIFDELHFANADGCILFDEPHAASNAVIAQIYEEADEDVTSCPAQEDFEGHDEGKLGADKVATYTLDNGKIVSVFECYTVMSKEGMMTGKRIDFYDLYDSEGACLNEGEPWWPEEGVPSRDVVNSVFSSDHEWGECTITSCPAWTPIEVKQHRLLGPADGHPDEDSFLCVGGISAPDEDGACLRLGEFVPSTNRDGFEHSSEQAEILKYTEDGFKTWAETGEPVRLSISSVAGSGKTTLAETIALLFCNMGLGDKKVIMTGFNTHIAKALAGVAKLLKKLGLLGFFSMGFSNTASAGGRALVFRSIRNDGFTPIDDPGHKYRDLCRIELSEQFDVLNRLRELTSDHEDVTNPVAGWMTAARGLERGVEAAMAKGIRPTLASGILEIEDLMFGPHGQRDEILFAMQLLTPRTFAHAVASIILDGQEALCSDVVRRADPKGIVPDSVVGYYSRRSLVSVKQLLGQPNGQQVYDALGLAFPVRKEKPKTVTRSRLDTLATTRKRGGCTGTKRVLAEWVDDGRLCLRAASWNVSELPMGNTDEVAEKLGITFNYPSADGIVRMRNLIRAASGDTQAPAPECQYRYVVPADKAQAVLDFIIATLGEGAKGVEIPEKKLASSHGTTTGSDATIPVAMADYIYAPVYLALRDPEPADLIILDEVQDFSELQCQFIQCFIGPHTNVIVVGDVRQSLYLFNFAEPLATAKVIERLGCEEMPMTICWRNSGWVVFDVHQFVKKCLAHAEEEGFDADALAEVGVGNYAAHRAPPIPEWREGKPSVTMPAHLLPYAVELGDLVTCRVNAPLAKLAIKTLIDGKKHVTLPGGKAGIAKVVMDIVKGVQRHKGADAGFGLIGGDNEVTVLSHEIIEDRYERFIATNYEAAVKRCGGDLKAAEQEQRFVELRDNADATRELLHGFIDYSMDRSSGRSESAEMMGGFESWLNTLCGETEGRTGHDHTIRFASVHRTKGAQGPTAFVVIDRPTVNKEGKRVTKPTFMLPHCMNHAAEAVQEINAAYVAVSRGIDRVCFVSYDQELADKYPDWESFRYAWDGIGKPDVCEDCLAQSWERVVALERITESRFIEDDLTAIHTHANVGDLGRIIHVENGVACVRFDKTGTATDVGPPQVRFATLEEVEKHFPWEVDGGIPSPNDKEENSCPSCGAVEYRLTPEEALDHLRVGGCVWLKDYTDEPETYGTPDYPMEDPDELETLLEEVRDGLGEIPIILIEPRPLPEEDRGDA